MQRLKPLAVALLLSLASAPAFAGCPSESPVYVTLTFDASYLDAAYRNQILPETQQTLQALLGGPNAQIKTHPSDPRFWIASGTPQTCYAQRLAAYRRLEYLWRNVAYPSEQPLSSATPGATAASVPATAPPSSLVATDIARARGMALAAPAVWRTSGEDAPVAVTPVSYGPDRAAAAPPSPYAWRSPEPEPVPSPVTRGPAISGAVPHYAAGSTLSAGEILQLARAIKQEGFKTPAEIVAAVCMKESQGDSAQPGRSGEQGLCQLLPETGEHFGLSEAEALDPAKNMRAAFRYLDYLYGRFHNWNLAIAAYNAGEGNVAHGRYRPGYIQDVHANMAMFRA